MQFDALGETMTLKSILACGVAFCLSATPALAGTGNLYGFGDSLVDNGNIPKLTGINYPPPPYYQNHFSNGPVWLEYLPGLSGLGFKPSNDYAVGGAFSGPVNVFGQNFTNLENLPAPLGAGFTQPLPDFLQQVQEYAATGQHFGSGDVVGVWVGANNYFAALGILALNPTNPTQQITTAVTNVANQTAQGLSELAALGARQILLFNLPNLGSTPLFNTNPAQAAVANEITSAHDAALAQVAQEVHLQTGANVILMNQQFIFQELLANPAAYGKTNVTLACINTPSCVSASVAQQNQYLFWDQVHPTTGTHLLIAEYANSALQGVNSLSVPARLITQGTEAFSSMLSQRIDALHDGVTGLQASLPGSAQLASNGAGETDPFGMIPQNKLSVFITGAYNDGTRKNEAQANGFNYQIGTVAAGADYRFGPSVTAGLAFGYGTDHANVDQGGSVQAHAYEFGAYGAITQPNYFLNLRFTYAIDDFSGISRPGVLAGITATPSGNSFSAAADGGYVLHFGRIDAGPVAGFQFLQTNINAYVEQGDPALTQSVQAQTLSRTLADIGVAASTDLHIGNIALHPRIAATLNGRLTGNAGAFGSVFTDEPTVGLSTSYPNGPSTWGVLSASIAAQLADRLSATATFETTVAKSNGEDHMVSAGLRYDF